MKKWKNQIIRCNRCLEQKEKVSCLNAYPVVNTIELKQEEILSEMQDVRIKTSEILLLSWWIWLLIFWSRYIMDLFGGQYWAILILSISALLWQTLYLVIEENKFISRKKARQVNIIADLFWEKASIPKNPFALDNLYDHYYYRSIEEFSVSRVRWWIWYRVTSIF